MAIKKLYFGGLVIFFIGIFIGITLVFFLTSSPRSPDLIQLEQYANSIHTKFVAVDDQGSGITADLITEIREGTGLVLVNINDVLADLNTQYSARIAAAVASNYTQIDLKNLDVIYNLKTEAGIIGGQSAATIMAVSTIAALQNKTLRTDVIATGSVNIHGDIVDAGSIQAKARAAQEDNFSLLLVPEGLGKTPTEFEREKTCTKNKDGVYCYVAYVGKQVAIGKDLDIVIKEVATVSEALEYFL